MAALRPSGLLSGILIGPSELIASYSLLVPKEEIVRIPLQLDQEVFELEIAFETKEGEPSVEIHSQGDGARIVFLDWDNELGTALAEPVTLVDLPDDVSVLMMASRSFIGATAKFDLQILLRK